jgi:hypothetical protein
MFASRAVLNSGVTTPSYVYVAANGNPGIFAISNDGGKTYTTRTNANSGITFSGMNMIYSFGSRIYCAQGAGVGVSNNEAGSRFTLKTTANGLPSNTIVLVVGIGSTVFVSSNTTGTISRSTDNGESWTSRTTANSSLGTGVPSDMAVSGSTLYVATPSGLSISTDNGTSFTTKTVANSGLANNSVLGVYASGSTVYAGCSTGLSISTDGGTSWTNNTTTNFQGARRITAFDSTIVWTNSSGNLWVSTDGGSTATQKTTADGLSSNTPFSRPYYKNGILYVGANTGLRLSTNGGASFTAAPAFAGAGQAVWIP